MKTKIIAVKGTWQEVLNKCRFTVGKEPINKEPSDLFKENILIAEHSPIRSIVIDWTWLNIKHWVDVHWARHKWEKWLRTARTDRTGVPRDKITQDKPQDFWGEANVQHLIDTMRKRLCFQTANETREYAEDLKVTIANEVSYHIADVLVPNCIYRGGCPEIQSCGFWADFIKEHPTTLQMSIKERYAVYNMLFMKEHIYVK